MLELTDTLDAERIRGHFDFPSAGRVVTNNAASTQPPRELLELYSRLVPGYENVHRGQSTASQADDGAVRGVATTPSRSWLNAPSRRNIARYRNTTEAHNAVMYSLLTEFRDGDNVVTTMLEHNSNFVPWYGCAGRSCPGSAAKSSAGSPGSTTTPASSTWITSPRWSIRGRSWSAARARRTSLAPSRR